MFFYLDLSRAFDSVTYSKLIHKLTCYGISGQLLSWLTVFLLGRKQLSIVDGMSSPAVQLISGVPQGSVLGPLLFKIYMNDLEFFMNLVQVDPSGIKLFADDLKVYKHIQSLRDAINLQILINTVTEWCDIWQLKINISKCLILHIGPRDVNYVYHISGFTLSSPNLVRDLGVLVDSSLSFSQHISQITQKARRRCVLFLKVFVTRDPLTMVKFFVTYVRPLLEYSSPVWSPISVSEVSLLESVQRFFTNKIPGCRFLPYHQRLRKLSLQSLLHRRQVADLIYFHAAMSGRLCLSLYPHLILTPPSITRGHNLRVIIPIMRYKKMCQNFISRTAPVWNNLSSSVLALSDVQFRRAIIDIIKDAYCP